MAALSFTSVAFASARAVRYEVDLTIDFAQQTISGVETIAFRGSGGVDLGAADMTLAEVSLDGEPLRYEHVHGRLRMTIPATSADSSRVRIRYNGKPSRGLRISAQQAFTAFHTNHWMVCDTDPAAKAALHLSVVIPATLQVVGTGRPESRAPLPDGLVRHQFKLERPHSTYLFGFAAGAFQEATAKAGRVTLRYVGAPFTTDELQRIFRGTPEMLAFFEERAGVPYPGDDYTQVLMPGGPAQEMAELTVMSERYGKSVLADPREDYLIAHELAHQWWGNLVTNRTWSDFWLNEGTATFMVAVYKERFWGEDEYEREMGMARLRYEGALAKGEGRSLVYTRWKTADEMGGAVTYSRGALVLHLLRRYLGEEAFWNGFRDFTRKHTGGTADSHDLRRALEASSGVDLQSFFSQWVFGEVPQLAALHRTVKGAVEIEVEQRQDATWMFPLKLDVTTATQRITRRVNVTKRRQIFRIPVDEPVLSVTVDPHRDLPDPIAHERPLPMLLAQLRTDPHPSVRIGAIRAIEKVCGGAAKPVKCSEFPAAIEGTIRHDSARLVRTVAGQTRDRLRSGARQQ